MELEQITSSFNRSNIPKYVSAFVIRDLWLSMPIFIFYLLDRGISFFEIGILEALLAMLIVISDIPSGALADLIGLRRTTIIGLLGWACGLISLGFATEFFGCLIAYLLIGFGDSLLSGASSALLYESLKRLKSEDKLLDYNGKIAFLSAFMIIIASLLGGWLYQINPSLPFFAHGTIFLIAALIIFTMQEPKPPSKNLNLRYHYQQMADSMRFTINSARIRYLVIYSVLIFVPIFIFVNIMEQPYLEYVGFPIVSMGIVFALTRGVIGFAAIYRYRLEKRFGQRTLIMIVGIYILSFSLMALIRDLWIIGLMMGLFFARDFARVVIDKYANDHIPSEKRATILSIINFFNNGVYSMGALLIGWMLTINIWGNSSPLIGIVFIFAIFNVGIVLPFVIFFFKRWDKQTGSN